jgi:hypothetical protein
MEHENMLHFFTVYSSSLLYVSLVTISGDAKVYVLVRWLFHDRRRRLSQERLPC